MGQYDRRCVLFSQNRIRWAILLAVAYQKWERPYIGRQKSANLETARFRQKSGETGEAQSGMSAPLEAAEHAGLTGTSLLRSETGAEKDALRMGRHAPRLCGMAFEEK